MSSPADRRYTRTHEWVSLDGDVATIGVTDFAQSELGDITYLDLPEIGTSISENAPFGVVESVKAANDIFSPVDGEIVERNDAAVDAPETVNSSPYGDAWLVKIRISDPAKYEALMDSAAYDAFAESSAH
jgi:glycine cleavage system H protein